ncbi:MAG: hypothetical protein ACOCUI_03500 [bacterium]
MSKAIEKTNKKTYNEKEIFNKIEKYGIKLAQYQIEGVKFMLEKENVLNGR